MDSGTRPQPDSPGLTPGPAGCGIMGGGIARIAAPAGAQVCLSNARVGAAAVARPESLNTVTILAANTSSLPFTAVAAVFRHPERVGGFHFNPVPGPWLQRRAMTGLSLRHKKI